jgi:hypothetical protein
MIVKTGQGRIGDRLDVPEPVLYSGTADGRCHFDASWYRMMRPAGGDSRDAGLGESNTGRFVNRDHRSYRRTDGSS